MSCCLKRGGTSYRRQVSRPSPSQGGDALRTNLKQRTAAKAIDHHPARIESPDGRIPHGAPILSLLTGVAAHGLSLDPFSNDVIMNSRSTINQFDPASGAIVASLTFSGHQFNQSAEDGKGHLFVADKNAHLAFVDYENVSNKHINGFRNLTADLFLITHLNDWDMGGRSSLRNKSYSIRRREEAESNCSVFFMHIPTTNR